MARILLVANTDWYLYNFRLSLARFLKTEGHDVVMVSPGGIFARLIKDAGFRWVEWRIGRRSTNPFGELKAIVALWQIYRLEEPDLVHQFTVKPVLYGSLVWRMLRFGKNHMIPAVVNSITGLGYVFIQSGWKVLLLRQVVKGLYREAFRQQRLRVIFENSSDQDLFLRNRLLGADQAWVIEGVGVDVERFTPLTEPQETLLESQRPVIVLPARMLWDKGVGVLVEAARQLRNRMPVRVVLVGNLDPGNPAHIPPETLQGWVTEGVVEWWGFQQDMLAVYRQADIIVLPSMGEGLPTVLIEASACARPIVATDVPGCRNVVEDGVNGFLVPPNDPKALADALAKLVLDPVLRHRLGQAGRQRAEERFSSSQVNAKTLAVYQAILPQP